MVIVKTTYSNLKKYTYSNSIITVGSFDGLHLGHKSLFKKMDSLSLKYKDKDNYSKKDQFNKIVITFDPHPFSIINFKNNTKPYILTTIPEKMELLKQKFKIDILIILLFDDKFSSVSAENFIKTISHALNPIDFIIGYNHRFGCNREGDIRFLKKISQSYNFHIHEIKGKKINKNEDSIISSTLIRNFLLNGNVKTANIMLDRFYSLKGIVIKGNAIGRSIKFPTINVSPLDKNQIIPFRGVYFVQLNIENKKYLGMCNIGIRPTLINSEEETIEIHIFGVRIDSDFYNKEVKVFFIEYIRNEKKFKNKDFLVKQLEKDKQTCLSIKI